MIFGTEGNTWEEIRMAVNAMQRAVALKLCADLQSNSRAFRIVSIAHDPKV